MSKIKNISPDKPVPNWISYLRHIIRYLRYYKHLTLLKILNKEVHFEENINFASNVKLWPPKKIFISSDVYIGLGFLLETNIEIGPDVLISGNVACIGNDHEFNDKSKSIINAGRLNACNIILEGNNLIGYGTIIIGDVRIAKGCIVGAGSVVTQDLPADTVCAGVPAKVLRNRYQSEY